MNALSKYRWSGLALIAVVACACLVGTCYAQGPSPATIPDLVDMSGTVNNLKDKIAAIVGVVLGLALAFYALAFGVRFMKKYVKS